MNEEKTGKCLRQVEQVINESVIFLVEQVLLTLSDNLSSLLIFSGIRATQCLDLCVYIIACLLSFVVWSLYCMSFGLRLLVTSLVPSQPYPKNIYKGINHFIFFALKPNYYWRLQISSVCQSESDVKYEKSQISFFARLELSSLEICNNI